MYRNNSKNTITVRVRSIINRELVVQNIRVNPKLYLNPNPYTLLDAGPSGHVNMPLAAGW